MDALIICLMFVSITVVPLVILFGGWIMRSTAAAEPNRYVGYRTRLSVSSVDAWQYANRYCGRLWMWLGIILLVASLGAMLIAVLCILASVPSLQNAGTVLVWVVIACSAAQVAAMILSLVYVERHLRMIFNKDGTRKNPEAADAR